MSATAKAWWKSIPVIRVYTLLQRLTVFVKIQL